MKDRKSDIMIYRGSSQVGGCCTEICTGESRILIDFGANLPGADKAAEIKDSEMLPKVFGSRREGAVLFTHYHGDHYGLFKEIPEDVPMYIGHLAKNILQILVSYIDRDTREKGLPLVERMRTYEAGKWFMPVPGIQVLPLYVDHSALDSYMFCIKVCGKTILFTGDFREHGIVGQRGRLERVLKKYVPGPVDVLITEGTMLGRTGEVGDVLVKSERELGREAKKLFQKHKYNFVLVSSTNLDSIMEFYHNTPENMHFVCDLYQARIMITAMRDMGAKGSFPEYQPSKQHPVVRVLGKPDSRWAKLRKIGDSMEKPLWFRSITEEELKEDGFVLLARKNTCPQDYISPFEALRDKFFDKDGQIIYSMWQGYLEEKYADGDLLRFIGGRPYKSLHTSGHAYVETIAGLFKLVNPKIIIPMHTEHPNDFLSVPEFAPYHDRVQVLRDGVRFSLDGLLEKTSGRNGVG